MKFGFFLRSPKYAARAGCILSLLILTFTVSAQQSPLEIPRLSNDIEFDGKVGDAEWSSVDTLSFVSHWPTYKPRPNARTIFRVAYDEKYLYFSAVCFDSPSLIQGPTFERDNWAMTMDQATLYLDTYNDNENGLVFAVTPTGSRIDVSIKNDAQGDAPHDVSWNSFWEAQVHHFENGWSTEVRIPFSSLRFQSSGDEVTMGMVAYRYIARERQMDIFPDIPSNWGFWSFLKSSKAKDVIFKNIRNKRPWFTSPYVLGSVGHHHVQQDDSPEYRKEDDRTATVGLDVQHALTDNMNMDITVNTDFAQVEADDQIVNLSRFSYFFPEKRRFFLERSSIMEFGFENNNRLFYSRRIGINEGQRIPIWGGVRLVGRIGKYDLGLMNIQSREKFDFPSENFGVLRLRRKVSKNNSYIGGILTTRTDVNGNLNLTYGVDAIINLFGSDYLKVNLAKSYDSQETESYANYWSDRKRIFVMWEKRSQVGLNYSLSYSQVDKNYSPGLGFESRNNFRSIGDRISYGWFPKKNGSLRYVSLGVKATAFFPSQSEKLESFLFSPTFTLEWKRANQLQLMLNTFYDTPAESFDLSDDITITSGAYTNRDVAVSYQTPQVSFLNALFEATAGTFYGGDRLSLGITPSYTISKYLTLSGFYQYNTISFHDKPEYIAHVGRLKVAASLNVNLSVNAFVQLNSLSEISAINFRLRYNWKDGNDLFIVYNETINNNASDDVYLPTSDYRAFTVKYIYTLHLGR
jgi:hypothetical protein